MKHGQGVIKYPSGNILEGTWIKNMIHGAGVLTINGCHKIDVFYIRDKLVN